MEREDLTIQFEAQLVSTSMTSSGGHKITLRVNPEDILEGSNLSGERSIHNNRVRSMFTSPTNTRYACVLVQLQDESDEPVVPIDIHISKKAISTLSMLCRSNEDWRRWIRSEIVNDRALEYRRSMGIEFEYENEADETLDSVKSYLGIESRNELMQNPEAVKKFYRLFRRFKNE